MSKVALIARRNDLISTAIRSGQRLVIPRRYEGDTEPAVRAIASASSAAQGPRSARLPGKYE